MVVVLYCFKLSIIQKQLNSFYITVIMTSYVCSSDSKLDVQNDDGRSPLHVAVIQGASCKTLTSLVSPSNSDMQDSQGRTPLHHALLNESYDSEILNQIVSILVGVTCIILINAT